MTGLIIVFVNRVDKLYLPLRYVFRHQYNYAPYVRNMIKTAEFLTHYESRRPFIYTWWATVADLEYTLPSIGNFKQMNHLDEADFHRDLLLVINSKWKNNYYDHEYKRFEKRFSEVLFEAPPFRVLRFNNNPAVISMNDSILFSIDGTSGDYITYGWGVPNQRYRPMTAENAAICWKFLNRPENDITFSILGYSLADTNAQKGWVVNLILNGRSLNGWRIDREQWYNVTIPAQWIKDNENTLVFKVVNDSKQLTEKVTSEIRSPRIGVKIVVFNEHTLK